MRTQSMSRRSSRRSSGRSIRARIAIMSVVRFRSTPCTTRAAARPALLRRLRRLDDLIELGHDQKLAQALGRIQDLDRSAAFDGRNVRLHDGGEQETVEALEARDVEKDLTVAFVEERTHAADEKRRRLELVVAAGLHCD